MTYKLAKSYMDINAPSQQAEASEKLLWGWSCEARQYLTKYYRCIEDEMPLETFTKELNRIVDNTSTILNEVQRELGGISIDYGRNGSLDLGIRLDPDLFKEEKVFIFTFEDAGYPAQFIDVQGKIHDDDLIFSDAQKFVEWYVSMRSFYLRNFDKNANFQRFYPKDASFEETKRLLMDFSTKISVPVNKYASDDRNLMLSSDDVEITASHLKNGSVRGFMYTPRQKLIEDLLYTLG